MDDEEACDLCVYRIGAVCCGISDAASEPRAPLGSSYGLWYRHILTLSLVLDMVGGHAQQRGDVKACLTHHGVRNAWGDTCLASR
jgi:hypothetical protein